MSAKYAVIFERAENNWAAYVPDLPGCITTGKTLEETKVNIREAIRGHLETMRSMEIQFLRHSLAGEVEVTRRLERENCMKSLFSHLAFRNEC